LALEEFKELFILIREYLQKQKEHLTLGAAESMTRLFFAAAVGLVLILLGGITLLLACFALAFWINEATGSTYIGFGVLAGVVLLLTALFWLKRKQWVLQPVAKLMVRIFLDSGAETTNTDSAQ
jgi:protein-S-isoprenylcysteine O-methyltransferase Ste14